MPFQMPKIDDIKSKTISPNTWKIYRTHLNKLFKAGYTNPDALLMNQKAIIDLIQEVIPGNTPDEKTKKRLWMSSIRWVLADTPPSQQAIFNEYYPKTFNDPAPGTVLKNGTKWVARDEFVKSK
jgi:hypothetical protein